jgi:hypothetical protein
MKMYRTLAVGSDVRDGDLVRTPAGLTGLVGCSSTDRVETIDHGMYFRMIACDECRKDKCECDVTMDERRSR